MSGSFLLDTNIIIGLLAAEPTIVDNLQQADEVFISSIAVGELFYGARKSSRVRENLERIDAFIAGASVLECDVQTAMHYGIIKNHLRMKGRPIPENDIWIAAICAQQGLKLVSRDAHFNEVDGLQIEKW